MQINGPFNIRIYGLVEREGSFLVIRERFQGKLVNKFPGGGLEPGEGVEDCLRREMREELGAEVVDMQLHYVNEFFQQSFRDAREQIISIYYRVKLNIEPEQTLEDDLELMWVEMGELADRVHLPIDKAAARRLTS